MQKRLLTLEKCSNAVSNAHVSINSTNVSKKNLKQLVQTLQRKLRKNHNYLLRSANKQDS